MLFAVLEREETVHITYEEYKSIIKPEATIQVYLKGTVKETKKSYAHNETFSFTKPTLKLKVIKCANRAITISKATSPTIVFCLYYQRGIKISSCTYGTFHIK